MFSGKKIKALQAVIDRKNTEIDSLHDHIRDLERQISDLESYQLKFEVTKLYVDDKEALTKVIAAFVDEENRIKQFDHRLRQQQGLQQLGGQQALQQQVLDNLRARGMNGSLLGLGSIFGPCD